MLRKILLALSIPPLLIAIAVLVLIGLKDFDLLVAIVSRLIVVAVIIGIPVMILKMIILPKKSKTEGGEKYETSGKVSKMQGKWADTQKGPAALAERGNGHSPD